MQTAGPQPRGFELMVRRLLSKWDAETLLAASRAIADRIRLLSA